MERKNQGNPFDHVDLQWFAEDTVGGETEETTSGGKTAETTDDSKASDKPPEKSPDKPRWFGTWVGQATPKYRDDEAKLDDLLKHKNIGEVLDRMYAAEEKAAFKPPESAEGYEFAEVEFPEELQSDDYKPYREAITAYFGEVDKAIQEMAHKNGWSKESAQEAQALFVKQVFEQEKAAREAFEKAKTDGLEALKKDWKGDFEPNVEVSRRAIETFGKEALVALFDELGVSNHPAVTKMFYEIGKAMGEDTLVPGTGKPAELSPEEQKQADLKDRYKNSPEMFGERKDIPVAEVSEANKARYPSMGKLE